MPLPALRVPIGHLGALRARFHPPPIDWGRTRRQSSLSGRIRSFTQASAMPPTTSSLCNKLIDASLPRLPETWQDGNARLPTTSIRETRSFISNVSLSLKLEKGHGREFHLSWVSRSPPRGS